MNEIPTTTFSNTTFPDGPAEGVDAHPASRSEEPHEDATSAEASDSPVTQSELSELAGSFNNGPRLTSGIETAPQAAPTGEASEVSHNPSAGSSGKLEKQSLAIGVFSGTWVTGKDSTGKEQNSVDLHVTGELGKSMNKQDLLAYLKTANALMQSHQENTGTPGELEWHPTGAVVTKGAVQLLSESLGGQTMSGSLNKTSAQMNAFWRKNNPFSSGQQPRNKMADRIDKDVQPEYFSYLKALKGVPGVSITPITQGKVEGFHQLSDEEQVKAFDQNMLEDSNRGKERFQQYSNEYNADPDFVPSLRIKVDQQHIPALIAILEKQK